MLRTRRAIVPLLLLLGAACLPAVSSSAEAWLPPEVVSEHGRLAASTVRLAADAQGAMTAVWQGTDGEGTNRVWWASRPAGATRFSPAIALSPAGQSATDPAVAVNATGAAVVAWGAARSGASVVASVTRSAAGAGFTEVVELSAPDVSLEAVDVGIDDTGRLTVVYKSGNDLTEGLVRAVTGAAGSTSWSTPESISETGTGQFLPRLAVDAAGRATAVWKLPTAEGSLVQASDRATPGGAWSTPQTLSEPLALDVFTQYAAVATNAQGRAVVAWPVNDSPTGVAVQVALREVGAASFQPPYNARPPVADDNGEYLDVAMDSGGTAAVAWLDDSPSSDIPDGLWVTTLSGVGDAVSQDVSDARWIRSSAPSLAVGPDDAISVAWVGRNPDAADAAHGFAVLVARRPAGGSVGPTAAAVTGENLRPFPAVASASGDLTVGYTDDGLDGQRPSFRVATLDGSPPALSGVSVPTRATVGVGASMSTGATDRWSDPVTLRWDFGDGTDSTGGAVSHAYQAPGSFRVRLTATDSAGNATTLSRMVTVSAAADTVAPVLSRARLKPALLPTGEGAKLRLTSTEGARLVGRIALRKQGTWRAVGAKRWGVRAGRNTLPFYGKAAERRLETGTYRVRLVATDPAGNRSHRVTLRFRVDRG